MTGRCQNPARRGGSARGDAGYADRRLRPARYTALTRRLAGPGAPIAMAAPAATASRISAPGSLPAGPASPAREVSLARARCRAAPGEEAAAEGVTAGNKWPTLPGGRRGDWPGMVPPASGGPGRTGAVVPRSPPWIPAGPAGGRARWLGAGEPERDGRGGEGEALGSGEMTGEGEAFGSGEMTGNGERGPVGEGDTAGDGDRVRDGDGGRVRDGDGGLVGDADRVREGDPVGEGETVGEGVAGAGRALAAA